MHDRSTTIIFRTREFSKGWGSARGGGTRVPFYTASKQHVKKKPATANQQFLFTKCIIVFLFSPRFFSFSSSICLVVDIIVSTNVLYHNLYVHKFNVDSSFINDERVPRTESNNLLYVYHVHAHTHTGRRTRKMYMRY